MIIVGAKGFAKEILEILHQNDELYGLAFFDNVSHELSQLLFQQFPLLRNDKEVEHYFNSFGTEFCIGIGNPILRNLMYNKFITLGGKPTSIISKFSENGSYDVEIGEGSSILSGAILSNGVKIGKCNIIYYNAVITHDVTTGDFVEISPGAKLLGHCSIGNFSSIGTNAVILPNIQIGKNVVIGAGAVVTKNLPDNAVATGIPAKIIKIKND